MSMNVQLKVGGVVLNVFHGYFRYIPPKVGGVVLNMFHGYFRYIPPKVGGVVLNVFMETSDTSHQRSEVLF